MGWWEDFKNALACKSSAQERCEKVSGEYILEGVMLKKNGEYLPFNRVSAEKVINKYISTIEKYKNDYDLLVWKDYEVEIKFLHCSAGDSLYLCLNIKNCGNFIRIYDIVTFRGNKVFSCDVENVFFSSYEFYNSVKYARKYVTLESKYKQSNDGAFKFLQDFINNCTPVATCKFLTSKKFKEVNCSYDDWLSINNGEYYTNSDYGSYIYKFSDWSLIDDEEEIYNIVKDANIELCDDPKKVNWKHFQHLEMLKKKKRDQQVKEYVDSVLKKQQEYNDLQLLYEATISAPIVDVDSFRNFCKIVHEDAKFEDYEIANHLMLLGKCKY